jgi:hypothetical protein
LMDPESGVMSFHINLPKSSGHLTINLSYLGMIRVIYMFTLLKEI